MNQLIGQHIDIGKQFAKDNGYEVNIIDNSLTDNGDYYITKVEIVNNVLKFTVSKFIIEV